MAFLFDIVCFAGFAYRELRAARYPRRETPRASNEPSLQVFFVMGDVPRFVPDFPSHEFNIGVEFGTVLFNRLLFPLFRDMRRCIKVADGQCFQIV